MIGRGNDEELEEGEADGQEYDTRSEAGSSVSRRSLTPSLSRSSSLGSTASGKCYLFFLLLLFFCFFALGLRNHLLACLYSFLNANVRVYILFITFFSSKSLKVMRRKVGNLLKKMGKNVAAKREGSHLLNGTERVLLVTVVQKQRV